MVKKLIKNKIFILLLTIVVIYNSGYALSVIDTNKYIEDGCVSSDYVSKYTKLGDSTNFFFKKTIYKVKKNG